VSRRRPAARSLKKAAVVTTRRGVTIAFWDGRPGLGSAVATRGKSLDLATLFGLAGALIIVATAIVLGGSVGAFIDTPSLVLVVGGTLLVTLMKFSFKQFANAARVAVKAFIYRIPDPEELIHKSVELANQARANGLLVLEEAVVPDEFFRKALSLVVDGHDPEVVRHILTKDLDLTLKRHRDGQSIFKAIGDAAPAMGMIGTLIGLVQMLGSMSDPKQIAPAMAIALLTTLYGALIANLVAIPIADKLALRSTEERLTKSLIIDAVMSIQDGQHPRVMRDLLRNYLPQSRREEREAA
jgi:chemotaxis protein MotA